MSICIFDIDGTLADCRHRLHFVKRRPKDWDALDGGLDKRETYLYIC